MDSVEKRLREYYDKFRIAGDPSFEELDTDTKKYFKNSSGFAGYNLHMAWMELKKQIREAFIFKRK